MEMNCSRLVGGNSCASGGVTMISGSVGAGQNGSLSGLAFSEKGIRVPVIRWSGFNSKALYNGVSRPHAVLRPQRRSILTVPRASQEPADNSADIGAEKSVSSRPASGLGEKQAQLMEQNRRLMTMQKQLMEQIEERKKLRMNLVQSLNVPDVIQESKTPAPPPSFPSDSPSVEKPITSSKQFKIESDVPSPQDFSPFTSSPSTFSSPPSSQSSSPFSPSSSPPSYSSSFPSNSQSTSAPSVPSQLDLEFESDVAANKDKFSSRRTAPFSNPSRPTSSTTGGPPSVSKSPSAPLPRNSPPPFTPSPSPSPVSLPQKPSIPNSDKVSPIRSQTAAPPSSPSRSFRSPQVASPGSASKLLTPSEILKMKKDAQTSSRISKEVVDKVDKLEPEPPKKEPLAGPNVMNVVVVASECAPWSKTGGLGDVVGALPKALARRGHRVMAIAPRYANYEEAWDTTVRKRFNVAGQDMEVGYFHGFMDGVDFVFIDNSVFHHNSKNIYGGSREEVLRRMILLCKSSIEAVWHVPCGGVTYGDGNLVFVANDWHTALLPVYLQAYYRDHGLMEYARSILVIHNIAHQGRGPMSDFNYLGLPEHYAGRFELYDPLFGGEHMNIFMAGITFAQKIVAVSHGYAWECQTPEGGWGLDGVIREHAGKLRGVVNGIDDKEWNPELDVFLQDDGYKNFSMDTLEDKAVCKAALQRELGLPVRPDVPLVGFIGRLDHQKGVDLIAEAAPWMMGQNMQLVLLGTGRPDLEDLLRNLEANHKDKVRGWVGFSVKTAHRITAGADILLMPSRFEPCGLNQLYAMKYGTIPVVHAVGGLRDTVKPFDPFNNTGYGWTFDRAEANSLIHALGNALYTYREYKPSWEDLQKRCMIQDLSWDNAAQQYEEVLVGAKYSW